jgi:DNA transformation protein
MPKDPGYKDHIMELLTPLENVQSRAMFGGYGIFHEGDMFALISSESRLYFKVGDTNRGEFEEAGSERFQRMPYWEVPTEILDHPPTLQEWARSAIEVGHATSKKKRA